MAKLYLVPTPVGNLEDITFRAVRILKEADLVLAEDTRVTAKLLHHYGITNKLQAYHQHNEHKITGKIVEEMQTGKTVALVTDAGTPGISDPGFFIVRECIENGIEVETLPGATAFVPALVNSGLPCERFIFEGFLPHKKGRQSRINQLLENKYTFVLYESPYRLIKTLEQLAEAFGTGHRVSVSREISKMHEETVRGTLEEVINHFKNNVLKGEFVIVCAAKD
jgi:16S rRNA (cytidine1402-2'-O)-methyltransferase